MMTPQQLEDVTVVSSFLLYQELHDPRAMFGSRKIRDAVNAWCRVIGVDPVTLRERMLLDDPKPGDDRHD